MILVKDVATRANFVPHLRVVFPLLDYRGFIPHDPYRFLTDPTLAVQ
jgi:hypothetical protein